MSENGSTNPEASTAAANQVDALVMCDLLEEIAMQKDKDLEQLQNMKPTQWRYVNWSEEGGGEVQMVHDVYVLFEIPQYGGPPQYVGTYHRHELNKLVDMAYSFT